jgi:hypothetical protein
MQQTTITAAQHARIVSSWQGKETGKPFAKLGESQEQATKRLMSRIKRARSYVEPRNFPKFKPGMSTAEYVNQYRAMNVNYAPARDFFGDLNHEPAGLYEGGALDFGAEFELIDDTANSGAQDLPTTAETDTAETDTATQEQTTAAAQVATVAAIATAQASAAAAPTVPAAPAAKPSTKRATVAACSAAGNASTSATVSAPSAAEKLHAERLAFVKIYTSTANMIRAKRGDAVAWVWTDDSGQLRALAWLGRSVHPYSGSSTTRGTAYRFKTEESRRQWLAGLIERAAAMAERTDKRRTDAAAARAAGHHLKVGDVLSSMWGYEQTNIDYYQVTKLCGSTMVEVRRIASKCEGMMTGESVPSPGAFIGEAKRYKVSPHSGKSISINSYSSASLIEPKEVAPGVKVYPIDRWTAYH